MSENKSSLRAGMLALRRGRARGASALSVILQKRMLAQPVWKRARSLALYVSRPGEAGTGKLLEAAWADGKTVLLPRLILGRPGEGRGKMGLAFCRSWADLRPGPYGIPEPAPDLCPWAFLPGEAAGRFWPDLFLLPGVAFDLRGGRLGQGGGYYDRFLAGADLARSFLVGLAFSFQLKPRVPVDLWDIRVQALCTEKRWLIIA